MTPLFWTIFILIIIIIFLFLSTIYKNMNLDKYKEKWQDYMTLPFDFISTGSSPINFYRKDIFRSPYMYPQRFYQSYPVPSVQYFPLL